MLGETQATTLGPVVGGAAENTIALLHFDGDYSDDAGNASLTSSLGTNTFPVFVFDKGLQKNTTASTNASTFNITIADTEDTDKTIEFIYRKPAAAQFNSTVVSVTGASSTVGFNSKSTNQIVWGAFVYTHPSSLTDVDVRVAMTYTVNSPTDHDYRLFVDGILVSEQIAVVQVLGVPESMATHFYANTCIVDELRISRIVRYTADYSVATSAFTLD